MPLNDDELTSARSRHVVLLKKLRDIDNQCAGWSPLSSAMENEAEELNRILLEIGCETDFDIFSRGLTLLRLGYTLMNPQATPNQISLAVECFKSASQIGCWEAEIALGSCYKDGIGVSKDLNEAERWYERAFDAGAYSQEACCLIASAYAADDYNMIDARSKPNRKKMVEWYLKAAKIDDTDISLCATLGRCYEEGDGVRKNLAKAKEWSEKAKAQIPY